MKIINWEKEKKVFKRIFIDPVKDMICFLLIIIFLPIIIFKVIYNDYHSVDEGGINGGVK